MGPRVTTGWMGSKVVVCLQSAVTFYTEQHTSSSAILIPVSTYCVCRWNLVLVLQHARPRPRQAARQNSGSVSHSQSDWGHGVVQQQQQHGWTGTAALRREKKDGAKEANDQGFNLDITRRERVLKGEAFVRRGHRIGTLIKYPLTGPRTCIARWCSLPDNIDRHRCLFWSFWGWLVSQLCIPVTDCD